MNGILKVLLSLLVIFSTPWITAAADIEGKPGSIVEGWQRWDWTVKPAAGEMIKDFHICFPRPRELTEEEIARHVQKLDNDKGLPPNWRTSVSVMNRKAGEAETPWVCINFFAGPGGAALTDEFKFQLKFNISGQSIFDRKLRDSVEYIITSDGDEDDTTAPIGDPVEQRKEGSKAGAPAFRTAVTTPRNIFIAVAVCIALAALAFVALRRRLATQQSPPGEPG